MVEQVSSGKYPGLVWEDQDKTMFRIPWKHAGKQDFRKDEDAAIFKAWAEYKGKLTERVEDNPANWKTRLRCALNKSSEFQEVMERAQLDISEPYKVYRLVPLNEQGLIVPLKKCKTKPKKRMKRRRRRRSSSSSSESEEEEEEEFSPSKQIKTEEVSSQPCDEDEAVLQPEDAPRFPPASLQRDVAPLEEIRVDFRIEENLPAPVSGEESFSVAVLYLGQEVLRCPIQSGDVRISYVPPSRRPPAPGALSSRFPRIALPEPPAWLPAGPELQALHTLLPFMQRGVALSAEHHGVYGKRFCQGRVFWTGPHADVPGPHKMERNTEPAVLFSKDVFQQQLDRYRSEGGDPPQCGVTLCFGEEFSNQEDPSQKLIIVQISLPWAEKQVQNSQSFFNTISFFQTLASESPQGEITLDLVAVPTPAQEVEVGGTP